MPPFNKVATAHYGGTPMGLAIRTLILIGICISFPASAADKDLVGTYKLVVEERTIVDTGEVIPVKQPDGYISYGSDGRMMVIIVRRPRPKPEAIEKTTDQERADLLRTLTAYSGTYKFDGSQVEHHIDISMNETWTGTTQVRFVKRDGNRLVYTTPPFRFHTDGKMSVNKLVFEKIN
jgi:Lipocalin-like domain